MKCRSVMAGFAALLASVALVASPDATASAAVQAPCDAVAHHENAFRNGYSCTTLPATPQRRWSVTLNGFASYPLIAGGRVFVSTNGADGGSLYALSAATGKTLWGPILAVRGGSYLGLAYDQGRLIVNGYEGTVMAFAAATGQLLWSNSTAPVGSGEPVVHRGVVYVQTADTVYAMSASTGAPIWTSPRTDGTSGILAVNDAGVFRSSGCSQTELALATGAVLWQHGLCTGGYPGTAYLSNGRVYGAIDTTDLILNQRTGQQVGTFTGIPAFLGRNGYFAGQSAVVGQDVTTGHVFFARRLPGQITTSPVIAGHVVFVGTLNNGAGSVTGISTDTGLVVWQQSLPAPSGGGPFFGMPYSDLGVGDGLLVVPGENTVTAFG